jgi:hypothetical protein
MVTGLAVLFYLFFTINKNGPFRDINPFGVDPYDAVGSIAIQAALLLGWLTYGRALRLRESARQAVKVRLVLRGNALILSAVLATLAADAIAEVVSQIPLSYWGAVLRAEQAVMWLLCLGCVAAVPWAFHGLALPVPPRDLTPADGIDDLWALVRIPVVKVSRSLPRALVDSVTGFTSDRLFARAPWLNPRAHPWRFACALGFLVGLGLVLAQFREGAPPSFQIGLVVIGIFLGVEFAATVLGFAVLGGYLGLRPSFGIER